MSGGARVGTVVVLLAAGLGIGQLTASPAPEPAAAQAVRVTAATAVCPDVRQDGGRATTVTAAGATDRDTVVTGPVHTTTARGDDAGALVVEQATRASGGSRRGLAALTCPAPSAESWFVGGATVVGSRTELMLVNSEPTQALVDVEVWTRTGAADPRPGRGIPVPARSRVVVPMERLAPDRDLLAVHVATTTGRVAAALVTVRADGRTPLGTDWVPQTAPPAREAVVPGLPQGPGRRTALLTNPGEREALVELELTTDDGQYVPDGLDAVAVPAFSSVAVDLSDQLADTPAALRVRSDGAPVLVGAVVVDLQRGAIREIAFAAATSALDAPTPLPGVRLSPPTEVTLLLSAVDGDAVVDLVPVAGAEGRETQRVEVLAATTVAVRLPLSALEVRPVRGTVHAARYVRERGERGPLTTLLPLQPSRLTVQRPPVVADQGARP